MILQKIQRPSDYEFFFENLNTADWIEPLKQEGLFKIDENHEVSKDGSSIHFPFWPPSNYLKRMASNSPKKVMDIILESDTKNPRINLDFLQAAINMPPEIAVKLHEKVINWLNFSESSILLIFPRYVSKYITHIHAGGYSNESFEVINKLLSVRNKGEKSCFDIEEAEAIIGDEYAYDEVIKEIAPAFEGQDRIKLIDLLKNKLYQILRIEKRDKYDGFQDNSDSWRGTIKRSNQNIDSRVRDKIINWLRDLSEKVVELDTASTPSLIDNFLKEDYPIFSRIVLHTVRESNNRDLAAKLILEQKLFNCIDVWHEYVLLVRDKYPELKDDEKSKFLGMISSIEDERPRYRRYYIIKDYLEGKEKELFNDLYKKYGDLPHPDFLVYHETGSGTRSPLSKDELLKKDIKGLFNYLETWNPEKTFNGPSIDGLGLVLEGVVAERSSDFIGNLPNSYPKEKTYIRSIVQGLTNTKETLGLEDWNIILNFILWICHQEDEETASSDTTWCDKDLLWNWSKKATLRLLKKGLVENKNKIPFLYREKVWSIISLNLMNLDLKIDEDQKHSSGDSYYQIAINSVRGEALEIAFDYADWVKQHLGLTEEELPIEEAEEFFNTVENYLDISKEKSKSVRAVLGVHLLGLFSLNREWSRTKIDLILPKEESLSKYWNAAWDAYICHNDVYLNTFEELQDHYLLAVEKLEIDEKDSQNENYEHFSRHIILFYFYEIIDLDSDIIKSLYKKIESKKNKQIISLMGRIVNNSKNEIEEKMIKRAMDFWDWRVNEIRRNKKTLPTELSELGCWMNDIFPEKWLLEQIITALELSNKIEHDLSVINRLGELAEKYPVKTTKALSLFIDSCENRHDAYIWPNKVYSILEIVLKTEASHNAERIIDKLLSYGYPEFGKLLKDSE